MKQLYHKVYCLGMANDDLIKINPNDWHIISPQVNKNTSSTLCTTFFYNFLPLNRYSNINTGFLLEKNKQYELKNVYFKKSYWLTEYLYI